MTPLNFIDSIDWKLLRKQKMWLNTMVNYVDSAANAEHAEGLLHLLDTLQDLAAEYYDYRKEEIFGESNGTD